MTITIPAWIDGRLQPVEKLTAHRRGLRHKAVSVFVMSGDALLLQKRAAGKYHTPGLWTNTCCTHPDWDEDPHTCAIRRLDQELGLTAPPLTHRGQVEYRADVGGGLIEHEVVDLFTADTERDIALAPDPAEVSDTAWMPLHDLVRDVSENPAKYTPWLRIYLEKHGEAIFGERLAS